MVTSIGRFRHIGIAYVYTDPANAQKGPAEIYVNSFFPIPLWNDISLWWTLIWDGTTNQPGSWHPSADLFMFASAVQPVHARLDMQLDHPRTPTWRRIPSTTGLYHLVWWTMNAINLYKSTIWIHLGMCFFFFGIYSVLYGNMGYGGQFMVGFTIWQTLSGSSKNFKTWPRKVPRPSRGLWAFHRAHSGPRAEWERQSRDCSLVKEAKLI